MLKNMIHFSMASFVFAMGLSSYGIAETSSKDTINPNKDLVLKYASRMNLLAGKLLDLNLNDSPGPVMQLRAQLRGISFNSIVGNIQDENVMADFMYLDNMVNGPDKLVPCLGQRLGPALYSLDYGFRPTQADLAFAEKKNTFIKATNKLNCLAHNPSNPRYKVMDNHLKKVDRKEILQNMQMILQPGEGSNIEVLADTFIKNSMSDSSLRYSLHSFAIEADPYNSNYFDLTFEYGVQSKMFRGLGWVTCQWRVGLKPPAPIGKFECG